MTTSLQDNKAGGDSDQKAPLVSRRRSIRRLLPNWRLCLLLGGYLLAIALSGVAMYLWQAPLSSPIIPPTAEARLLSPVTVNRDRSKASLEVCLQQVKVRDLFKPSVPVPTEDGIGKSTAQELAERLQFLGIMDDVEGLAALVFIPNRGPGTFHVGDRVAEFVLKDVQVDRLTLELGDENAILKR